jgi:hypothetical protein
MWRGEGDPWKGVLLVITDWTKFDVWEPSMRRDRYLISFKSDDTGRFSGDMFGAFVNSYLKMFQLARRDDGTSIRHPCGLVDDNDDVTLRGLGNTAGLDKF